MKNLRHLSLISLSAAALLMFSACSKKPDDKASGSASTEPPAVTQVASQAQVTAAVNASPGSAAQTNAANTAQATEFKNADGLVKAITAAMPSYDEAKLLKILENFNQQQLKEHGINAADADGISLPQGTMQVEFQDAGDYFALEVREVLQAHANGVDTGEDQFRSLFFDKKGMRLIADKPMKSQALGDAGLRIGIGEKESCMGIAPGESFSIFDLKQGGKVYHQEKMQDQPYRFDVKLLRAGAVEVTTRSESEFTGSQKEQKQCEIGSWVNITETTYSLVCDTQGGKCSVQKKIKRRSACSETGGCD